MLPHVLLQGSSEFGFESTGQGLEGLEKEKMLAGVAPLLRWGAGLSCKIPQEEGSFEQTLHLLLCMKRSFKDSVSLILKHSAL